MANLAARLVQAAADRGDRPAVILAGARGEATQVTFGELDRWSDGYAHGVRAAGLRPGDRVLLLMRPGGEFVALVFGLLKAGLSIELIDPGMERSSFLGCVERAAPQAMVGVLPVHLLAALRSRAFTSVRKRWIAGLPWAPRAIERVRRGSNTPFPCEPVADDSTAAIVFTTGSTGVPKGVVNTHGNYSAQLALLRRRFSIEPEEVAIPGYLPFALLCLCMGNTCVIPHVHPARPGSVDPAPVLDLMKRYRPAFGLGSPAFWGRIGEHCARTGERLDGLRLLLLFGAEVHEPVLRGLQRAVGPDAEVHTTYGSTEAQPISTISDRDLLTPGMLERRGELGVCVGAPLEGVEMRLVPVADGPIDADADTTVAPGAIGEVAVRGPMVTAGYYHQPEQDRLHKIGSHPQAWHRMGDCGSLDADGRLWLAGRKTQRVETAGGTLFPLPVEARVNRDPALRGSALVGVGGPGAARPVVIIELADPAAGETARALAVRQAIDTLAGDAATRGVRDVLIHPRLPMDYRHNAKIQREALARWAADRLR